MAMAATGDMKNNVKQLQSELKAAKYPGTLDTDGIVSGLPKTYLAIYHYIFTTYSTKLNKDISNSNNELYGKSDMRFMEAVYKILRDMFQHKPQITRDQFFSPGFAERKVIMGTEILRQVRARYKPPKSGSAFRVMSTRSHKPDPHTEKIEKEPIVTPDRPRKVASRNIPDVSGAIVLPSRMASAANGFRIPRSAVPHLRQTTPTEQQGHADEDCDSDDETPRYQNSSRAESVSLPGSMGRPDVDAEMKRRVVDLVSPALVMLNERLGKMEISLQDIQATPPPPAPQPPQYAAMATGLSRQMSDVIFKLDTLTSRVLLVENRLMMVEAKLDDEAAYHQTLSASRSVTNTKVQGHRQPAERTHSKANDSAHIHAVNTNQIHIQTNCGASHPADVFRQPKAHSSTSRPNESNTEVSTCENDVSESHGEEVELESEYVADVKVVRGQEEDGATTGAMGFMKTLVGNNESVAMTEDSTLGLQEDDSSILESRGLSPDQPWFEGQVLKSQHEIAEDEHQGQDEIDTNMISKNKAVSQPLPALPLVFTETCSPIRHFARQDFDFSLQDESAISIPCGAHEDTDNRRASSTPAKQDQLDTSTLDRVTRISQMMAETANLFR